MAAPRSTVAPLRVLCWPLRSRTAGNPYVDQLTTALRDAGVQVEAFTGRRMAGGGWDVCHVHWPEWGVPPGPWSAAARRAVATLAALAVGRARGTRICWTVHNLVPHEVEHPRTSALYWRAFLALVGGTIRLSRASGRLADEALPGLRAKPSAVIPHGHYTRVYAPAPERAAARERWGWDADDRVVAFLGQLRAYKGVGALLDAFRAHEGERDRLLVAGNPADAAVAEDLRRRAAGDGRIALELRRVAEADVPGVLGAADVVALPFDRVLNSGSAILALSFARPVLVPDLPGFRELAEQVGAEWVVTYAGALGPDDLARAVEHGVALRGRAPELSGLDWAGIGAATAAFYRRLTGTG